MQKTEKKKGQIIDDLQNLIEKLKKSKSWA